MTGKDRTTPKQPRRGTTLPADAATTPRHPIRVVSRRTGLRADLLRAWERRYGAVDPDRSETRRRLYSDADVERLLLIKRALDEGRSIGQIARLGNDTIAALLDAERAGTAPPGTGDTASAIDGCLRAVKRLDGAQLALELERAVDSLGRRRVLEHVMPPMLEAIGEAWERGRLLPAHEHLASAVVRSTLGAMVGARPGPPHAPRIAVATPPAQRHELGALMAAALAVAAGWSVTYLGPDLPFTDLAAAVAEVSAAVLALSITVDAPELREGLAGLRRALPPEVAILVGGRARGIGAQPGIELVPDLASFPAALARLGRLKSK